MSIEDAIAEATAVAAAATAAPASPGPTLHLTPRERDVLRLLVEGQTNQEIALALKLSVKTVNGYVANILGKLDAESRTAAATYAIRHSLV